MASFTPVVAAAPTNAADINQLINALNGTTNASLLPQNVNTGVVLSAAFTTAPGTDKDIVGAKVVGDANHRMEMYIRGSDGYGGIAGGAGTTYSGHFYATASGWAIPESLAVTGALTISGSAGFVGATFSSGVSITGALTLSGGGTVNGGNIPGFIGGGTKISVQGTAPGSPSVSDLWINTSTNLG